MVKIVIMGEIMLRLSTPNNEKFIQTGEFDISYGGGEVNVAVSPANYGHEAEFIIAVPANPIGECAVVALRKCNVDIKYTARSDERLGIYLLEIGSVMRAPNVVYDYTHSLISIATAGQFNSDEIFVDADWLRFIGTTPAVGDAAIKLTEATLKAAKIHNVTVSADLDFRKELWPSEEAQKVMTNLIQYVDARIGNEENVEKVLGFKPDNIDVTSGESELAGYVDIFNQMADKFSSKHIISSLWKSHSASDNGWSACIMDGKTREFYHSRKYHITPIVDCVSGDDSFAAGLTCGLVDGKDMKAVLEYAVAVSVLKHTIPGGFNPVTRADVEDLVGGDGSDRVQR